MTKIEWTDQTWNVVTGCDRVSPGCDNCYALTMAGRLKAMGQPKYQRDGDPRTSGPGFGLTIHPDTLDTPLHWRKPRRVFVNSMSDLFHPDVPDMFIGSVWDTMAKADRHTFQILTKRPQRMECYLSEMHAARVWRRWDHLWCGPVELPLPNVWLGTSIESDRYTFRAIHLRRTPASVHFLSLEPLLGPLPSLDLEGIDWVIVGGESGPGARPMHPEWVRNIRDRCVAAGVPFFFKQWGAWAPMVATEPSSILLGERYRFLVDPAGRSWTGGRGTYVERVGKKAAGRELDGREWSEMPAVQR